jgi:pimeloyl-ACP methyl ester carboxylesterase
VDRLVLVSCANRFGPYLREIAKLLKQTLRRFPLEMCRRTIELLGTSPEYFDAHWVEIERKLSAADPANGLRTATARQLWCLGCEDVAAPDEYRIHAPTLVIAGERDLLIPAHCARQMAGEIPGSEYFLIPGCGHNPLLEKPTLALGRIVEFLSRPAPAAEPQEGWLRHTIEEIMQEMEEVS